MNYPSKLIESAVVEISKLPGIGKKTALRLVLHLLKQETETTRELSESLLNLRFKTSYCTICKNIAEGDLCNICANPNRDKSIICIVEDVQDVLAIENTHHFHGLYHVLEGVISPIEGIGPSDLNIESLLPRIAGTEVKEIIFALSATMQGDTTCFYITRKLKEFNLKISTIARGISIGGELEYTDEVTLGKSILGRINYEQ